MNAGLSSTHIALHLCFHVIFSLKQISIYYIIRVFIPLVILIAAIEDKTTTKIIQTSICCQIDLPSELVADYTRL